MVESRADTLTRPVINTEIDDKSSWLRVSTKAIKFMFNNFG